MEKKAWFEQAPGGVGGLEVGGVAVAGEVEAVGEGLAGLLVVLVCAGELLVDDLPEVTVTGAAAQQAVTGLGPTRH